MPFNVARVPEHSPAAAGAASDRCHTPTPVRRATAVSSRVRTRKPRRAPRTANTTSGQWGCIVLPVPFAPLGPLGVLSPQTTERGRTLRLPERQRLRALGAAGKELLSPPLLQPLAASRGPVLWIPSGGRGPAVAAFPSPLWGRGLRPRSGQAVPIRRTLKCLRQADAWLSAFRRSGGTSSAKPQGPHHVARDTTVVREPRARWRDSLRGRLLAVRPESPPFACVRAHGLPHALVCMPPIAAGSAGGGRDAWVPPDRPAPYCVCPHACLRPACALRHAGLSACCVALMCSHGPCSASCCAS